MKKKLTIFIIVSAVMFTTSCMKDMPDSLNGFTVSVGGGGSSSGTTPEGKTLKASVESLSFSSDAGNQSFGITSNTDWRVSSDADWVKVSESTTRGSGNGTVTVSVQQNTATESRTGTVTISSTQAGSVQVSITQAGANSNLQLNKNNLSFTATGGSDSFSITSHTSWAVTSDQTWCTVSTSSGSNNATVTVNVLENLSIESRSATIIVKAGDQLQTIAVTQAGADATLQLSKFSMSFDSSSDSESFIITSNTNWTAESSQSWCTLSTSTGFGNGTVTVRVSENTSTDSRTATVTVSAGDRGEISQAIAIIQAGTESVDESTRTFTVNGVSFNMIRVDGGTFMMGATSEQGDDAWSQEKPAHQVTLSSYYIGETEVTQALWQAVMGSNPSYFSGSNRPVERVSWDDCQDFIKKLNSITGGNFRLPTEAEWEFAARGGNKSRGYKYAGSNTIDNVAWYGSNSNSQTLNVATKAANELGLYDMSGNVYEWCQDWYGNYSSDNQTNPRGPGFGSGRVCRGGGYCYIARCSRVSYRSFDTLDNRVNYLGLRLALQ